MKTTKNLFLLIAFFTVSIIAQAQILTPVKWTKSVKMTDDRNGVITFTATIDNGWHMYSNDSPADGPTPLSVKWKNTKGVKLVGGLTPSKAPTTIDDEAFMMKVRQWEGKVTLTQKFTVTEDKYNIDGDLQFMSCNDQTLSLIHI